MQHSMKLLSNMPFFKHFVGCITSSKKKQYKYIDLEQNPKILFYTFSQSVQNHINQTVRSTATCAVTEKQLLPVI